LIFPKDDHVNGTQLAQLQVQICGFWPRP